jgi:hypothetical protein
MNDCVNGDIKEALPELVGGTLASADLARVREHVRVCADCAAEVEILRAARSAMKVAPTMDTVRIAEAVRASTAQRMAARRAPTKVARLVALTLVLALGAVGVWSMRNSPEDPRVAVEGSAAAAPVAARGQVQLALGGDMSQLEDEQLLALMQEVSALEAMPGEDPASLAIEPVIPIEEEEL